MFISRDEVEAVTGHAINAPTLQLAQLMIETWVGRDEADVENAADIATLGRATAFQAVYIMDNPQEMIAQALVKSISTGDSTTTFATEWFAPFISPWAIRTCQKLSWLGTRSVHTGAMFSRARALDWERT